MLALLRIIFRNVLLVSHHREIVLMLDLEGGLEMGGCWPGQNSESRMRGRTKTELGRTSIEVWNGLDSICNID